MDPIYANVVDIFTDVRPSPRETGGLVLFNLEPLHAGDVASLIPDPVETDYNTAFNHTKSLGLPEDSFFYVTKTGKADYDASWTDPSDKPNWYCTDHAHPSVANIRMEIYPFADGRNSIAYIATKDIPGDTELRFTYGGPTPPAWNADKIKIDGRKRAPVTTDNIVHYKRSIYYKRTRE